MHRLLCFMVQRVGSLVETFKTEADWYAEEALKLGVPDAAIMRERRSTNTGENIVYAYELLQSQNIDVQRAIIVHKPYMLRRDYATIMKQLAR